MNPQKVCLHLQVCNYIFKHEKLELNLRLKGLTEEMMPKIQTISHIIFEYRYSLNNTFKSIEIEYNAWAIKCSKKQTRKIQFVVNQTRNVNFLMLEFNYFNKNS